METRDSRTLKKNREMGSGGGQVSLMLIICSSTSAHACLKAKAGLKHVPVLHAKVGQEERVEGVRVEMGAVAEVRPGIEVVRSPDDHAILFEGQISIQVGRSIMTSVLLSATAAEDDGLIYAQC